MHRERAAPLDPDQPPGRFFLGRPGVATRLCAPISKRMHLPGAGPMARRVMRQRAAVFDDAAGRRARRAGERWPSEGRHDSASNRLTAALEQPIHESMPPPPIPPPGAAGCVGRANSPMVTRCSPGRQVSLRRCNSSEHVAVGVLERLATRNLEQRSLAVAEAVVPQDGDGDAEPERSEVLMQEGRGDDSGHRRTESALTVSAGRRVSPFPWPGLPGRAGCPGSG